MAEIEIGLGAVIGDEDLPVLVGAHRAGIDVEVGVELAQPDLEAARLQQRAERRRRETLAERGDHAAGNEDEPRHGTPVYSKRRGDPTANCGPTDRGHGFSNYSNAVEASHRSMPSGGPAQRNPPFPALAAECADAIPPYASSESASPCQRRASARPAPAGLPVRQEPATPARPGSSAGSAMALPGR